MDVLILIFLENALRHGVLPHRDGTQNGLNPYFFGKCSTARGLKVRFVSVEESLNPYFFGKCSTADIIRVIE